jgi:putative restriction endonuclease
MRAWVGVTDWDWYRFLQERGATEVNFWRPSDVRPFSVIPRGAPFLFKSKFRDGNRIVGGGFFEGWTMLPTLRAWEIFGEGNGSPSLAEMRTLIRKYRADRGKVPVEGEFDYEIGCIMLRDVKFLEPGKALEPPPGWPKSAVQGKGYDLASPEGTPVERTIREFFGLDVDLTADPTGVGLAGMVAGSVLGDRRLSPVRLGQSAFKALVLDGYKRRCAITGGKIVPVLEAAHIRPVSETGENRVDNGLLLRSDIHTLFDRGYLGIHPEKKTLMVSHRLRSEWGNGDWFYQRAASGEPISLDLSSGS